MGRVISLVFTVIAMFLFYFLLTHVNTMFLEVVNKFNM